MSIENGPHAPSKQTHSGHLPVGEGGERPHPDAQPLDPSINTEQIVAIVPANPHEGFKELPPTASEKSALDQYKSARRNTETESRRSPSTKRKLATGALAGAILIGGGGAATVVVVTNSHQSAPTNEKASKGAQSATESTPTASPSSIDIFNSIQPTVELTADQDPTQLAKNYVDLGNQLDNALTNPAIAKDSLNHTDETLADYSMSASTKVTKNFIPVLYGSNYESDPTQAATVARTLKNGAILTQAYISTANDNGGFNVHEVFDSFVSVNKSEDTETIKYTTINYNNSADFPTIVQPSPSGHKFLNTVVFKQEGNKEVILTSDSEDITPQ